MKQRCPISLDDLHGKLQELLTPAVLDGLDVSYAPAGRLPAAAKIEIENIRFRLEYDPERNLWILASDEPEPRLLDHFVTGAGNFQEWLLSVLHRHSK